MSKRLFRLPQCLFGLLGILVVGVLVPACRPATGASAPPPLPSWLTQLNPGPGSTSSGLQVVEVKHNIVTPEYLRLVIDGVDVTAYATKGPSELDYRPAGQGPVGLAPGKHSARVDRMRPVGGGGPDGASVVASYSWSFTIN